MGRSGVNKAFARLARLSALGVGALALANCSGGVGRIDPRWGVAASPRVIPFGEPVPKGGGVYRVGKPYRVGDRTYVPTANPHYTAVGYASWYGREFRGRYTANGEIFDQNSISAASPVLPMPSYARVTNLTNHRSIVVRVNDRGPYVSNRILDVSTRTAKLLGFYDRGVAKVKVQYVGRAPLSGSSNRELLATLRQVQPGWGRPEMVAANDSRYMPAYFDSQPIADVPTPPERPYDLADGHRMADARPPQARTPPLPPTPPNQPAAARYAPTTELAAASRPQQQIASAPAPVITVTPVSAYAPVSYDEAEAGFMSGRGLY